MYENVIRNNNWRIILFIFFFCLEFHVVFVHEKREKFPNIFVGLIKHRNASYFERIFCQHVWYVDYISNHRKILSWLICFFPLFIVWCCVIPHEMSNNKHYFVSQNYRLVARQKEICLQKYLNSFCFLYFGILILVISNGTIFYC